MNVIETALPGVLIIEPKAFGDHRGFFLETFQVERYREAGITLPFVQDNHSRSQRGVLRGLHFQKTRPQGKLVSVSRGAVYDVAVDIDPASATYGQFVGVDSGYAGRIGEMPVPLVITHPVYNVGFGVSRRRNHNSSRTHTK